MTPNLMRRRTLVGGVAGLALAGAGHARAQPKLVKLVVPFGSGAVMDTIARAFLNEFARELGSTVIVESRAGAGGLVGTASVARGPTDGSELLVTSTSHHIAAALYPKLPFDPHDLVGAAYIGSVGYAMVVPSDLSVASVAEFVRMMRAEPGRYNYASAGNGSNSHLAMAALCSQSGLEMQHIPTKSTGDALVELLGGRAHAVILSTIGVVGLQSNPRVKILATTGTSRNRYLLSLPTIAEAGVPGYEFESWVGLLAPAKAPQQVVEKVHACMERVLRDKDVDARLDRVGVDAHPMGLNEFRSFLTDDMRSMAALVKTARIKVD